jgi:hypothetical protein
MAVLSMVRSAKRASLMNSIRKPVGLWVTLVTSEAVSARLGTRWPRTVADSCGWPAARRVSISRKAALMPYISKVVSPTRSSVRHQSPWVGVRITP